MTKQNKLKLNKIGLMLMLLPSVITIHVTAAASHEPKVDIHRIGGETVTLHDKRSASLTQPDENASPHRVRARVNPDEITPRSTPWLPHLRGNTWALSNFILSAIGVILAFTVALCMLIQKKQSINEDIEAHKDIDGFPKKYSVGGLVAMLATAFAGVLLLILSQDMTKQMVIADRWTIAHISILVSETIAVSFVLKRIRG